MISEVVGFIHKNTECYFQLVPKKWRGISPPLFLTGVIGADMIVVIFLDRVSMGYYNDYGENGLQHQHIFRRA